MPRAGPGAPPAPWYALADLYERAGDVPRARELFRRDPADQPGFADVAQRLAHPRAEPRPAPGVADPRPARNSRDTPGVGSSAASPCTIRRREPRSVR